MVKGFWASTEGSTSTSVWPSGVVIVGVIAALRAAASVKSVTLLTEAAARKAAMTPTITTPLGQTLVLVDPSVETLNPFTMGASRRDPGRRANEVEHPVELRRAFYLASTETTNAQFRQYEATHDSGLIESYSLDRDHQPVAGISWQQAASFCNWLSRLEGLPPFYRENQGIIIGFNPSSTGYRYPARQSGPLLPG